MPVTRNNTLPDLWQSDIEYSINDTVTFLNIIYKSLQNENSNHVPNISQDYWQPCEIYLKDLTVMKHGDYSGDESFWERDHFFIDSSGYIWENNENTGINVNGRVIHEIRFSDLTPDEIELLKQELHGDKGDKGDKGDNSIVPGPQGPQGPQGPDGKSAFEIWQEQGHEGETEADFIEWIRTNSIPIDDSLSPISRNAVENQAITNSLIEYQRKINELLDQYEDRITDLENRLKATYQSTEHTFRFGITNNGQYGYRIDNSDAVYPFQQTTSELNSMGVELINGLGLSDMGKQYILNENTILDLDDELQSTSLLGDVSTNSNVLNRNVAYSNNVQTQDFDDFFNDITYEYVFKDGEFPSIDVPYNLQGMTYDTESDPHRLYSKGETNYEGIWFDVNTAGAYGNRLQIKVQPYNCESVNIVMGNTTDTTHTIEEIINDSALQIQKITRTITENTTIKLDNIATNQRIYFFSNNTANQFRITEILVS